MKIITKDIKEIKPYEKNPRKNDEAVEYVIKSIKEFGFKVPIIIDKNNTIVAGHTRYKACEKLNINKIPCIIADDLTEQQIKAFRLADNKVSEYSCWDFDLLNNELSEILDIDISDFGFELCSNMDLGYIDDILSDNFVDLNESSTIFTVSFNFPKEKEETILSYIKDNGKDDIVKMIIDYIEEKKCQ